MRQFVVENLRHLQHAPSVQMQDVPPDLISLDNIDDDLDPDVRMNAEEEERR